MASDRRLQVRAIETRVFHKGENLTQFILDHLPKTGLPERTILAITSKIISLAENETVPVGSIGKMDLVKKEADRFLCEAAYGTSLTIKHGILIPAAGIDESNSETGEYILFPKDPYASAKKLWTELRNQLKVRSLGIIVTDSHTQPLRQGVTGIGLAHWGFKGTKNFIGKPDIFGRILKMSQVNVLDALAVPAVFVMGEADERCPLAILEGTQVEFTETTNPDEIRIAPELDIYAKIFQNL